jgi:DNA mismatch repair protein MutS
LTGYTDDRVDNFFHAPPRDLPTIDYRQQVFRDLDRNHTRRAIQAFVDDMRTMRRYLDRAERVWHPPQRQGRFVEAVKYCDAAAQLDEDLANLPPASGGLRGFADVVSHHGDSDTFRMLVDQTDAVQAELHEVRYIVHIQGLAVHVEKFDGQADYSGEIVATFERFAIEASNDYRVPIPDHPDMNHVKDS